MVAQPRRQSSLPAGRYFSPQLPEHWIEIDADGRAWLYPAGDGGWSQRVPYRGYLSALRRAMPDRPPAQRREPADAR